MKKLTFEKENNIWYIVLKKWPGPKGALAMVQGADLLLDKISKGKDLVTIEVYEEAVDDAIKATLILPNRLLNGGNYTVEVVDTNGCGQGITSPPVLVTVFPELIPVITISPGQDTLYCTPAQTYQWYFNGNPVSGANQQYYIPSESGNYQVFVTDNHNCEGASAAIED